MNKKTKGICILYFMLCFHELPAGGGIALQVDSKHVASSLKVDKLLENYFNKYDQHAVKFLLCSFINYIYLLQQIHSQRLPVKQQCGSTSAVFLTADADCKM